MKLWHDDTRPSPKGWVWARTNDEAKRHLATGEVEEASLDHDLGYDGPPPSGCEVCDRTGYVSGSGEREGQATFSTDPRAVRCPACDGDGYTGGDALYIAGTSEDDGYELAKWMVINNHVPPKLTIHSWNYVGAENMRRCFVDAGHACEVVPYRIPIKDMI